jgi:ABC-type transporter Mla subunit MlaD
VLLMDLGFGIGVVLVGVSAMIGMLAVSRTLARVNLTLDEVDRQLVGLGAPVTETLNHVESIAGSAEETLGKLGKAVASIEGAASTVSSTTTLTKEAISPAIVNLGATLTGLSAGLRRLVTGKDSSG